MVRRLVDMIVWGLVLLGFLAGLMACQAPQGSFCQVSKPLRLSNASVDALSDQEVAAVLAHNRKGAALCGWTP